MATTNKTETPTETVDVPSLFSVLETEEIVGADAAFELTEELRNAVERGLKATEANPGGWLRVTIPAKVFRADGSEWAPTDAEAQTICSERENELRTAAAQMGYAFRRQTPKKNGTPSQPRVLLYRVNRKSTDKSAQDGK